MNLDERTSIIAQIAAAAAVNALTALRFSITEGLALGLNQDEIRSILSIAREIQQQPQSHAQQLADQLLREPVKKKESHAHVHGPDCGCHS